MKIASLVVRAKPEHFVSLQERYRGIPGVQVHACCERSGRMVVSVEDGEGYAVTDSILAVSMAEHALSVTLAFEYTDEGLELQEA
ncbi:nitrate reductase [Zoogloeaceae bacteirum Par-f-2]|uniref:chaperone NapD n=1 Tax=Pseudothauera hydrothermalis TaxID=2184083 RepID=UPI000C7B35A5|nr:chaperone NapD [Pseudothauera hydrothermalis]AUM01090.1 nitrate reductase [Rhodocyclaceae bacterium]AVZ80255.1 nitrate reductase [Zoogloeaceae bacteirum Par-f-2]